jgi:hypothetical protein
MPLLTLDITAFAPVHVQKTPRPLAKYTKTANAISKVPSISQKEQKWGKRHKKKKR